VPKARGAASSVPLEAVLEEAGALFRAGARELVVSGINLGGYQSEGMGLCGLLKKLLQLGAGTVPAGQGYRLRISSIEPQDGDDDLIELMAKAKGRICRHLHLPLQSGSDAVLAGMGRRYTRAEYTSLLAKLRSRLAGIAVSTDVIVGFPGESDADFDQTLATCRACAFSRVHVFRFSLRPGTVAAKMAGQVASGIAAKRGAILRALALELESADARRRLGTCEEVLLENPSCGLSESYHRVQLPHTEAKGSLVPTVFCGYNGKTLLARLVKRDHEEQYGSH
jgi:threonylcarbamoyladenosine tRNA methylthiotransferase MtaB